jgi:hypothetical protein
MFQVSTSLVAESGDCAAHEKVRILSGFMTGLKMPISYSLPSFLSIWFLGIDTIKTVRIANIDL